MDGQIGFFDPDYSPDLQSVVYAVDIVSDVLDVCFDVLVSNPFFVVLLAAGFVSVGVSVWLRLRRL